MEREGEFRMADERVSVLFSEPKIPQSAQCAAQSVNSASFSALQRAENSSIDADLLIRSCEPCFSALQRAENSSIWGALRATPTG